MNITMNWAYRLNDADIAKLLIDAGADVNTKDNNGETPLHKNLRSKVKNANASFAKLLIDAGADVNAKDNDGKTPLHNCKNGAKAQLLIDAGADVNAKDKGGDTPLHLSRRAKYKDMFKANSPSQE